MAELTGLPIPKLDWNAPDLNQNYKRFKALCELLFKGPLKEKSEEELVSYLKIWSGEEGIELVETWNLSNDDKKKLQPHWDRFETHIAPKSNFRLARFKLRGMKQAQGETVDSFIKKVHMTVNECQYQNPNEHIIDSLIFGTNSQKVQAKLLQKDNTLTVDQALDIARTEEATEQQLTDIQTQSSQSVHSFNRRSRNNAQKLCGCCGKKHCRSQALTLRFFVYQTENPSESVKIPSLPDRNHFYWTKNLRMDFFVGESLRMNFSATPLISKNSRHTINK